EIVGKLMIVASINAAEEPFGIVISRLTIDIVVGRLAPCMARLDTDIGAAPAEAWLRLQAGLVNGFAVNDGVGSDGTGADGRKKCCQQKLTHKNCPPSKKCSDPPHRKEAEP